MSVINQALKKAQKLKEHRNIEFAGGLVSGERKGDNSVGNIILYSLLFIVFIFLLFLLYSFLEQDDYDSANVSKHAVYQAESENIMTPETLYKRAKQLHNIGSIAEAKELYLKSLELDPGFTDALNNLGVICIHEKEYLSARKYFEKAVVLKPRYPILYYNLACLLSIGGETEESMMYLKKAISLDQSVAEWARKDTDLESLRGVPEFKEIIKRGFN